jgi:aminoglycoside phosphotransferase (APT) family kinase protein
MPIRWAEGRTRSLPHAGRSYRESIGTLEQMPHAYTNHTFRHNDTVFKSYRGPDAAVRCRREAAALEKLSPYVPVPPLIATTVDTLTTQLISGVHGSDLLTRGHATAVMQACGSMLRQIHQVDLAECFGIASSLETVLVHGDYGPNNVLLDPERLEITAVVDWEWMHMGAAIEDLAWCEWIMRIHHPTQHDALASFFVAYASCPAWRVRHQAMVTQCAALVAFSQQWQSFEHVQRRREQLAQTEVWVE